MSAVDSERMSALLPLKLAHRSVWSTSVTGAETRTANAAPGCVSIASGTPPAAGADGSFAWRIIASFTVERFKLSLYVDILGFVLGPARVTLVSSGVLRPFPAAIQQRLFLLLLARARARAL